MNLLLATVENLRLDFLSCDDFGSGSRHTRSGSPDRALDFPSGFKALNQVFMAHCPAQFVAACTSATLHDVAVAEKYALVDHDGAGIQVTGCALHLPSDRIDLVRLASTPLDASLASASDPSAFLRGVACHGQPYAGRRKDKILSPL